MANEQAPISPERAQKLEALYQTITRTRAEAEAFSQHWASNAGSPFYYNALRTATDRWNQEVEKALKDCTPQ